MEAQVSDTGAELQSMEDDDSIVVLDKLKLKEVVANGSLEFDEWTSLISEIERAFPDNIEEICLVYDSFLSKYPLCYIYWRKYAYHKMRLCTIDKAVEVFDRAVQSATYSVDVWVDYCSFASLVFEDHDSVRRLFKRGLSFVGKDYLSHALWDKYIQFEFSQQQWSSLADIYIQTLRFPTKRLHCYYDSFKKLVEIWEEEMRSHSNCTSEEQIEPMLEDEVPTCYRQDVISRIIKDLLNPSVGITGLKALERYKLFGERLYQETSQLDEKIKCFEAGIRRPYFHVKPLDLSQLENWHRYLDFVELRGDFDWAVLVYERCLIPCANYPEFWMRYVEFVESKGGREIANDALDRATKTYLKRESVIHLFNARFKEHIRDVSNAGAAFPQCDIESESEFVENVVMKANMEKRLGDFTAASNTYKEALDIAAVKEKWHILPILYVHFSRLTYMTTDSEDATKDILMDGIKCMPYCKLLIEELIKFAMTHRWTRHINEVDSIVANAISTRQGVSQDLSTKDGEDISKLYLEFVDLCGTVNDVRMAWNRHVRVFPHTLRTTAFCPAIGIRQWRIALEAQQENNINLSHQPSGDYSADLIQSAMQDDKPSLTENDDTQAAHPETDHVLDQRSPVLANHESLSDEVINKKLPSMENHNMLPNEGTAELLQSRECDTIVQETIQSVSPDSVHQVNNENEGVSFSKEKDTQQVHDHESGQDLKPPPLEQLSLDLQVKSPGPVTPTSNDSEAPQEPSTVPSSQETEAPQESSLLDRSMLKSEAVQGNTFSNRSTPESGQHADADWIVSGPDRTQAASSSQINIVNCSPSSSASNQNMAQAPFQPQIPVNNRRNWHSGNASDRNHRDSRSMFRGNSHKKIYQQRRSSPHQRQAEMEFQTPPGQGYHSQPLSYQNPKVQQGSQVQSQYPTSAAYGNLPAVQAWSMQNSQQQNPFPAYQSQQPVQPAACYPQPQLTQNLMQSNEQHGDVRSYQAYNQMCQYYNYQQQLLWQQQQNSQLQPQQRQLLQHHYQQQLLQLQFTEQQLMQLNQLPYQQQSQLQQQQQQQQQQLQMHQQQVIQQQLLQQQQLQHQFLYMQQMQLQQSQQHQPLQQPGHPLQQNTALPQEQQHGQQATNEQQINPSESQVQVTPCSTDLNARAESSSSPDHQEHST